MVVLKTSNTHLPSAGRCFLKRACCLGVVLPLAYAPPDAFASCARSLEQTAGVNCHQKGELPCHQKGELSPEG